MNIKPTEQDNSETFYKTLVESTKALPWQVDWKTMAFSYVGPQIKEMFGWNVEDWAGISDWAECIHPDDRDRVVENCLEQSIKGVAHETDYRILVRGGDYIWIRDVVHVICNEKNEPISLVGLMFDIHAQKSAEEELILLKQELEVLSYQDCLTGVANRRFYDAFLVREWELAKRNCSAISMIMLDIDFFKQYNDSYGHHAGDSALQVIANTLKSWVRDTDLVARIGGEEFVIIILGSTERKTFEVAERIRIQIEKTPIIQNGGNSFLTASFGMGVIFPYTSEDSVEVFQQKVDRLLYCAKQDGRNQVKMSMLTM